MQTLLQLIDAGFLTTTATVQKRLGLKYTRVQYHREQIEQKQTTAAGHESYKQPICVIMNS